MFASSRNRVNAMTAGAFGELSQLAFCKPLAAKASREAFPLESNLNSGSPGTPSKSLDGVQA